jgi:hypothetical protein
MDEDLAAIHRVVQLYFEGMHNGDAAKLREAFHPSARVQGVRGGEQRSLACDEFVDYVASVGSRPAAGEAYDMHIVSIDRAGSAAIAKVAILWNDRRYTDYLAMIRRADGWSISEKTFYSPT